MTKEDLIKEGYKEYTNKRFGKIYIKGESICVIHKDETVDYYSHELAKPVKIESVEDLWKKEIENNEALIAMYKSVIAGLQILVNGKKKKLGIE